MMFRLHVVGVMRDEPGKIGKGQGAQLTLYLRENSLERGMSYHGEHSRTSYQGSSKFFL